MPILTARTAAWSLVAIITVLSVVPPLLRPVTGTSQYWEHLAVFALTGLTFGLGYRGKPIYTTSGLVAFAAVVEIIQLWVPGRHARMSDFVIDALSASIGVLVGRLVLLRKANSSA